MWIFFSHFLLNYESRGGRSLFFHCREQNVFTSLLSLIFVVKQTLDQDGSVFVEKHLSLRSNVQKVCTGWMPRGHSVSLGSVKLHSSNAPATSRQLPAAPLVACLNDFSPSCSRCTALNHQFKMLNSWG